MNTQEMWLEYQDLAYYYAQRIAAPLPMREEVVGDALLALGKAIEKYRPDRGPFPPYLRLWVRSVVRQREAKLRPLAASRRAVRQALQRRQHPPGEEERERVLDVHVLSLEEMLEAEHPVEPAGDVDLEEEILRRELRAKVREALETLSPRHRQAVILYYGLDGVEGRTYEDVGRLLGGVTRQRAYQLVQEALKALREHRGLQSWVFASGE